MSKRPIANSKGVLHLAILGEDEPIGGELKKIVEGMGHFNPYTSDAQRRAMYAAAAGHSTLGIPKKVGREFVKAGPASSHLPKRKGKKHDH